MNLKKITIQHNNGFAKTIYILQSLITIIMFVYFVYSFTKTKILLAQDFSLTDSLMILLAIVVIFLYTPYLKAVYCNKKIIIADNILEIEGSKYYLNEIYFKYVQTTILNPIFAAKLYYKDTNKEIALLVFSFWSGNILNITPDTFEAIFDNSESSVHKIKEKSITVNSINMDKENQELKQLDKAWYIIYGVLFIPVILILYLMIKS